MFFLTPFILAASLVALPFQAMHSFSRHPNYGHISNMSKYNRVFQGIKPVIMMFSAPWCHACKMMEPNFDYIASLHNHNVDFYVVNTDEVRPLIDKLQIKGLPTIICAKEGQVLHQERRGAMDKRELADCVHTFLSKVTSLKKKPKTSKKKQQAAEQPPKKVVVPTPKTTKKEVVVAPVPEKKPIVKAVVKNVPSKKVVKPKKIKTPVQKRNHRTVVQDIQPTYETVPAYFYEEGNPNPINYLEVDSYPVVM